jgi:hypothetical protein
MEGEPSTSRSLSETLTESPVVVSGQGPLPLDFDNVVAVRNSPLIMEMKELRTTI